MTDSSSKQLAAAEQFNTNSKLQQQSEAVRRAYAISNNVDNNNVGVYTPSVVAAAPPSVATRFSNITSVDQMEGSSDDDDDDEEGGGRAGKPKSKIAKKKTGGSGRRRIDIKYIENKSRRQVTFSRRKRGLMKKVLFDTLCSFLLEKLHADEQAPSTHASFI